MSDQDCLGLPHLCCNCRACNVRRMSSTFTQVWARNTRQDKLHLPECPGWVIDVQARGSLYILWRNPNNTDWFVQKRTLDGAFLWNIEIVPDVASDFVGHRIDSDDTTVWVCAMTPEFTTQKGLFAYSADDGTLLWSKQYPHYDVDPDGTGGCVVAVWGGPSGCSNAGTGTGTTDDGNVQNLDANGDLITSFGIIPNARSVLVQTTKVWVGGETSDYIYCFCDSTEAGIRGSVARHDLATGNVELICAGGEWVVESDCKVQSPIVGVGAYVTRLALAPSGNILCGVYGAGDYDCLMFELDPTTGQFDSSYDISSLRESLYAINSIIAIAVASGTIFVVATNGDRIGLLLSTGGLVKRHTGYLKDLWADPAYIVDGSYSSVTAAGSDIIVGGEHAGCTLYDDDVSPGAIIAGDCDQPCGCGDFNTRGQAVVGCGCEDGVDPTCEAYLNLEFTGCLASLSGVVNLQYNNCRSGSCYNCTAGQHHWTGSTSGSYDPFAVTSINCCEVIDGDETENCSECCASLSMSIDVCYDCVTGWILKFCVTVSSAWYSGTFKFTGVIESENCNPPTFTFTWDGTADSSTGTGGDFLTDCCGGTTGCGGFNTNGCGIMLCCDEPFPTTLTATFSAANCAALHGTSLTLNYVGEISANIHAWEASINIAGCGDCTFRFQINNNVACEWAMGIQQDSSGTDIWGCFDSDCDQGSISCPFVSVSYTNSIPACASSMDCAGDLTVVVA